MMCNPGAKGSAQPNINSLSSLDKRNAYSFMSWELTADGSLLTVMWHLMAATTQSMIDKKTFFQKQTCHLHYLKVKSFSVIVHGMSTG